MAIWLCFWIFILAFSALIEDTVHEEAFSQVVGIHDGAASELDSLSCVVYPSKVDIECCLYDSKDDGDGLWLVRGEHAIDPIEDIEATIGSQCDKVEGIDDGWYSGLSQ